MHSNILDLILTRRTVHSYLPEAVPAKVIEEAVLAGIHAPNHKRTWPWRFFWLSPDSRAKLAKVNEKFLAPGEMIVLAINKAKEEMQAREDYAALACAVQNMSLYLASIGYGSKWSTGKLMRTEGLYEVLGHSRDEIEIWGVLWVGRAAGDNVAPKRPEVSQFLKLV